MKANELMIDDWVYRYDCYDQVKEISNNGIIGLDSLRGRIMFGELKPIPLTADILEKNFIYDYGLYFFGDDYIEVYIEEYADGLWRVEVDEIEMSGLPTWCMLVSNVHELQHALRLAGIEKEIKL